MERTFLISVSVPNGPPIREYAYDNLGRAENRAWKLEKPYKNSTCAVYDVITFGQFHAIDDMLTCG